MRPFGVWGVLVNSERDDRYGSGNGAAGSGSFALSIWLAVAALAVLFAVVALVYGSPVREVAAQPPRQVSYGGGATLLRGTPAPDASSAATTLSGRSDMVGAPGRDSDLATELAKVRIENAALRQATELLRGQIETLSERVGKIESHLSEMTGSISATPIPKSKVASALPSAAPNFDDLVPDASSQSGAAYTQFGMELGTYGDLSTLKKAWSDLVRQYPALFEGLDGLATIRDRGGRTELLLIAGPFQNAAEAAERCGKAEASGLKCLPAFYLGQQLSMH